MKNRSFFAQFLSLALINIIITTGFSQTISLDGKTYTVKVDIQKSESTITTVNDEIVFAGGLVKAAFSTNSNFLAATYNAVNSGVSTHPTITFTATSTGPTGNLIWSGTISDSTITGSASRSDDHTVYSFSGKLKTTTVKVNRTK